MHSTAPGQRIESKIGEQHRAGLASGRRHRVFCASMADIFDNRVPAAWRGDLWALIRDPGARLAPSNDTSAKHRRDAPARLDLRTGYDTPTGRLTDDRAGIVSIDWVLLEARSKHKADRTPARTGVKAARAPGFAAQHRRLIAPIVRGGPGATSRHRGLFRRGEPEAEGDGGGF
jgi:hypothetical protein